MVGGARGRTGRPRCVRASRNAARTRPGGGPSSSAAQTGGRSARVAVEPRDDRPARPGRDHERARILRRPERRSARRRRRSSCTARTGTTPGKRATMLSIQPSLGGLGRDRRCRCRRCRTAPRHAARPQRCRARRRAAPLQWGHGIVGVATIRRGIVVGVARRARLARQASESRSQVSTPPDCGRSPLLRQR